MRLEHDAILPTEWSRNNDMKLNNDNVCHHLIMKMFRLNWRKKTAKQILLGMEIGRKS